MPATRMPVKASSQQIKDWGVGRSIHRVPTVVVWGTGRTHQGSKTTANETQATLPLLNMHPHPPQAKVHLICVPKQTSLFSILHLYMM